MLTERAIVAIKGGKLWSIASSFDIEVFASLIDGFRWRGQRTCASPHEESQQRNYIAESVVKVEGTDIRLAYFPPKTLRVVRSKYSIIQSGFSSLDRVCHDRLAIRSPSSMDAWMGTRCIHFSHHTDREAWGGRDDPKPRRSPQVSAINGICLENSWSSLRNSPNGFKCQLNPSRTRPMKKGRETVGKRDYRKPSGVAQSPTQVAHRVRFL